MPESAEAPGLGTDTANPLKALDAMSSCRCERNCSVTGRRVRIVAKAQATLTLLILLATGLSLGICGCGGSSQATISAQPSPSPPPTPTAARFVYVAERFGGRVSIWSADRTTGMLTSAGSIEVGTLSPVAVALDPLGNFAYVIAMQPRPIPPGTSDRLLTFRVDPATGALTSVASMPIGSSSAFAIVVDPLGRFAYAAAFDENSVSMYSINPTTGVLSSIGTGSVALAQPVSIVINSGGKLAFIVTDGSPDIPVFSIDQTTGVLRSIGAGANNVSGARTIALTPSGQFAYVPISNATGHGDPGDTVGMFSVDSGTGALTSIGAPVATGFTPNSLAVDPTGRFVYVANLDSNNVSMFGIDVSTGILTSLGPAVATGAQPTSIVVDPSGEFVYVGDFGSSLREVSIYSVDTSTGKLTSIGTMPTLGQPVSLAISRE